MEKSKKREIRFIISEKRYKELKDEAKSLNVPMASLIKMKLFGNKDGL